MILAGLAGLSLGFASWLHCVGMCGPLVSALHSASATAGRGLHVLAYHAGRTLTYIVLGLLLGAVADTARLVVVGSTVSIVTGTMIVVMAVAQLSGHAVHLPWFASSMMSKIGGGVRRRAGTDTRTNMRSLMLGAVNGLLPCGVSLSAVIAAATLTSVPERMMFLLSFGLATSPALVALSMLVHSVTSQWRARLTHASALVLIVFGLLVTLRGMALDIPFVSPHIATATGHDHSQNSCCNGPHK